MERLTADVLTSDGLVSVESRQPGADERNDRQVDEPDEETGSEVQVELSVFHRRFNNERRLEFNQEPEHDCQAEDEYQPTRPRLPFVYVRDVVYLHLACRNGRSTR